MTAVLRDTVNFLSRYSPDKLEHLRANNPAGLEELRGEGMPLGGEEMPHGGEQAGHIVDSAVRVMLTEVERSTSLAVMKVGSGLEKARKFELIGSVTNLASSGGVVIAALRFDSIPISAALAIVSLVAGVFPIVVNWFRGSITSANVAASFIKGRDCAWEAQLLTGRMSRSDFLLDKSFLEEANSLAKKAYITLGELGFRSEIKPV